MRIFSGGGKARFGGGGTGGSGGGTVLSVFGRTGTILAVLGDYAASKITNDSGVAGATVKDALNNLASTVAGLLASDVGNDSAVAGATVANALNTLGAAIAGLVTGVSSVYGRTGAVVAALNDYAASLVDNDSSVAGATVADALDTVAATQGFQPPATSAGATPVIDFAANRSNVWTLSANGTPTFVMPVGYECYLELVQSGAGAFTVTWPAIVDWTDQLPPTLTTTTGKRDLLKFVSNGTRLRGFAVLMNF